MLKMLYALKYYKYNFWRHVTYDSNIASFQFKDGNMKRKSKRFLFELIKLVVEPSEIKRFQF